VATVGELSDPYANFMLNPLRPETPDVCSVCLTFTQGFPTCWPCGHAARYADAVLPISYSVHLGQLHTALSGYKRDQPEVRRRLMPQLASVLWRFVEAHEACLARRVGVAGFEVATVVPSGSPDRDAAHPLRWIVENAGPTKARFERTLQRTDTPVREREVDAGKFRALRRLDDEDVLLIDDTWTTGASAQSAAGALKAAGARTVGIIVMGRHVRPDYASNAARLADLPRGFDWSICAFH
jgi:hypothetical protein